jgi:hypothetical protein
MACWKKRKGKELVAFHFPHHFGAINKKCGTKRSMAIAKLMLAACHVGSVDLGQKRSWPREYAMERDMREREKTLMHCGRDRSSEKDRSQSQP